MNLIRPPAYSGKYDDRFLDLQRELDSPLADLVRDACRAGWNLSEVMAAVIEAADNQMLAAVENQDIADKLEALRQSRR
ncbi:MULTISPECIES: hypothetical protein [unclassified Rhizobium]|uniref:hypothetical protein n=1 Tax=unclassified Rhizobium TaxID=2613769 RepID=UPI0006F3788A|nr:MULTISPECIES: hypothetical protein [unclassified Rhizobium]KQV34453.1 hypothetical protein ASC86_16120 [Rhizobium sp. Root1212]KRD25403.1 hypothetical protein ASE37_24805 [Rhizobium sp. Root268]